MSQIIAIAKNVRISPTKVRLVADEIRKLQPTKAIAVLDFVPNKGAKPLKKAILSALANAKNNAGLSEESMSFKEINVQKGMVFKRFRPISRGRAHSILKRTSNIKVVLEGEKPKKEEKKTETKEGEKNGTKS